MLQGFALLNGILELLLDFFDPGLELLTGGLLLDSFLLGLAQGLPQGLDLGRAPAHITTLRSIYSAYSFRTHNKSSLTLLLLEPNLNLAELVCRVVGATYAKGWLIIVGANKTSPVPGNGMRRRHARR